MRIDNLTSKQNDYAVFLPALSSFYGTYIGKQRHDPNYIDPARIPADFENGIEGMNFLNEEQGYFTYRYALYSAGHAQLDLEKATEWLTIPEVAEKLNLPLGKIHRLIEEHSLIEYRINGVRKVPIDAIKDGEPLPNLRGTVLVLLDSGFSVEGAIEWLYSYEDSLKSTPMAALIAGKKAEIRRLAQALAI